MTESTTDLFGPVAEDLAAIEQTLRREIEQDPAMVGNPMLDLFAAGGKRIRPGLVLLSAKLSDYDITRLAPAAMAVELTHAATLVHDDVIDQSATRRGRPTVAASMGNEPAIVIGDYYFAKAYERAAATGSAEVVAILARAVMRICDGEVRQQSMRYHYHPTVDEYIDRIAAKTAILIGACCEIGALLSAAEHQEDLLAYGQFLGVAFQIADDVLDYTGAEGDVGKPLGHDLVEGFATLPLILTPSLHLEDGHRLDDAEAQRIVDEVRNGDGPDRALAQAREFSDRARSQLRSLPPGDVKDSLSALAGYVVTRKL